MSTGVMIGYGFAIAMFVVFLIAGYKIGDSSRGRWLNIIFVFGGGITGWIAGLLAIPFPDVPEKLTDPGAIVGALAGGVVGTKLIEALSKKIESGLDTNFIGTCALFLFSFLLGGLSTVIWRLSGIK